MPRKPKLYPPPSGVLVQVQPLRVPVEEAAVILGISSHAVFVKIRDGALRSLVDGRRTLLTLTELRRYVEATDPVINEPLEPATAGEPRQREHSAAVTP
jgi:excisionase family DNA binding protein